MQNCLNFDKEGSKFETKNVCVCVCVWRGVGRGAMTPKLYAKLGVFFNFLIFFLFNFFLIFFFLIFFF